MLKLVFRSTSRHSCKGADWTTGSWYWTCTFLSILIVLDIHQQVCGWATPLDLRKNMAGWRYTVHLLVERGQLMECRIRSTGIWLLFIQIKSVTKKINVFIMQLSFIKLQHQRLQFSQGALSTFDLLNFWASLFLLWRANHYTSFFLSSCFSSGLYTGCKHGWHFLVNVHKHAVLCEGPCGGTAAN